MKDMSKHLTDETLTAYALGELNEKEADAVERAIEQALLEGDDGPQTRLDEIRAATEASRAAFQGSDVPAGLSDAQRNEIADAMQGGPRTAGRTYTWRAAALAATVLVGLSAFFGIRMYEERAVELAEQGRPYEELSPAEKAERQFEQLQQVRPGIERYLITDINNPGTSSMRPDFERPDVQQQIQKLHERTVRNESRLTQVESVSPVTSANAEEEVLALGHVRSDTSRDQSDRRAGGVGGGLSGLAGGGAGNAPQPSDPRSTNRAGAAASQLAVAAPGTSGDREEQLRALGYLSNDAHTPGRALSPQAPPQNFRYRPQPQPATPGTESYPRFDDSAFVRVSDKPLSTFSIDVDTASYANVRRFLNSGLLPPPDAVRVEELINYFDYSYPTPEDGAPFAAHMEVGPCPWAPEHRLVQIGLKGKEVSRDARPPANLVFLLDVSGSMKDPNKLPLVKRGMQLLVEQLDARDRVAIVTYASTTGVALPSTSAVRREDIQNAIGRLHAGGSTNGSGGIQLAYRMAREHFVPEGVNRVILATDGDFNVGITDNTALEALIQREAQSGTFLTVLGFGMGNLKDDRLEMLSNKGNGTYAYVDSMDEARKVFLEDLTGTLVTIAKDVKIQVEFNPAQVEGYRLIGYENRALAPQDFNDDRKDAGEIGAGHTVTALYEIVPAGMRVPGPSMDPLRYQSRQRSGDARTPQAAVPSEVSDELLLLKLRYKEPEGSQSRLLTFPLRDSKAGLSETSPDFRFASAVAAFGRLLRGAPLGNALTYGGLIEQAQDAANAADDPRKNEFVRMAAAAQRLLVGQAAASVPAPDLGANVELLRIREVRPSEYQAQIRAGNLTGWYGVGYSFDAIEVVEIDPVRNCVTLFNRTTRHVVEVCLDGTQRLISQ